MNDFSDVTTFSKYQEYARKTAVFPKEQALAYLTLGLASEVGEFEEKLKEAYPKEEEVLQELGDIGWYLVMLCDQFAMNIRHTFGEDTDDFCKGNSYNWGYHLEERTKALRTDAFKLCGIVKKHIRDDPDEMGKDLKETLHYLLIGWKSICHGYCQKEEVDSPFYVAQMNLKKLYDRKDRGVLKGKGDDR